MAAIDPVCGMTVEESKAAAISTYKGKTYYFCAKGCKVQFDKNPEKYLSGKPDAKPDAKPGEHGMMKH